MEVVFYFDVGCADSHVAAHRVARWTRDLPPASVAVRWVPVARGALAELNRVGNAGARAGVGVRDAGVAPGSPALHEGHPRRGQAVLDVCLESARHGVMLDASTLGDAVAARGVRDAMRLVAVAEGEAVRRRLARALFKVRWGGGSDALEVDLDPAHLAMLSAAFGVDGAFLASPGSARLAAADAELEANARAAFADARAPGVPCFALSRGGELQTMFYGADRLALLDARVRAELAARGGLPYPRPVALDAGSAGELVRRNRWAVGGAQGGQGQGPRVDFFFDLVSPWSYLAFGEVSGPIDALCRAAGVPGGVTFRPVLLGALFKQIGTASVPGAKVDNVNLRRYGMRQDFHDWAQHRGVAGRARLNAKFPFRSSVANRVCCAEPRAVGPLFRAGWEQDVDLGDEAQVERVLVDAGFDGHAAASLVARAKSDPELRRQLEANTADAVAGGICGAPAIRLSGARGISQVWDELTSQVPPPGGAARAYRLGLARSPGLQASRDLGAVTFWGNDRLDAFVWFLVVLARYNAANGKGDGVALWDEQRLIHSFATPDAPFARL